MNPEDISVKFEAVKIAMTQDKNGHILKLAIHPSDTPEDIMRDLVGQRYVVVMVKIDEHDQPIKPKTIEDGEKAVRMAGILASDDRFQEWLVQEGMIEKMDEELAAAYLRKACRVVSRSELKTNTKAREELYAIRDLFAASLRKAHGGWQT